MRYKSSQISSCDVKIIKHEDGKLKQIECINERTKTLQR